MMKNVFKFFALVFVFTFLVFLATSGQSTSNLEDYKGSMNNKMALSDFVDECVDLT